jgi:hypothetical protein
MSESQGFATWVDALGVRLRIDADRTLTARLEAAWSACLTEPDASAHVTVREPATARSDAMEHRLERVTQEVTQAVLHARAGQLLMLHACAVADPRTGASLIFVGPSGMGKTTLALALGREWGYVTDEAVGVEPDGRVVPYRKPLSLRTPGEPWKRQVSPDELGLRRPPGRLQVARLLLLDRQPGAREATISTVSTVHAMTLLAEHTSYLLRLDRPLGRLAEVLEAAGGLRRVAYADAGQIAGMARSLLEGVA